MYKAKSIPFLFVETHTIKRGLRKTQLLLSLQDNSPRPKKKKKKSQLGHIAFHKNHLYYLIRDYRMLTERRAGCKGCPSSSRAQKGKPRRRLCRGNRTDIWVAFKFGRVNPELYTETKLRKIKYTEWEREEYLGWKRRVRQKFELQPFSVCRERSFVAPNRTQILWISISTKNSSSKMTLRFENSKADTCHNIWYHQYLINIKMGFFYTTTEVIWFINKIIKFKMENIHNVKIILFYLLIIMLFFVLLIHLLF